MAELEQVAGTYEPAQSGGGGHLRLFEANYSARKSDVFVPPDVARAQGLRGGELVAGTAAKLDGNGRGVGTRLTKVESVNGLSSSDHLDAKPFEDLIPIDPEKQVRFEHPGGPPTMRIVDLMTPIGFGQRGLIVAPPRTGKTVLLQHMAAGVSANHPDVYMMVLLIDERPEEVTEMRRTVHGEVVASSNDQNIASHVRIARLMIEKAKRMVESGQDVFVLLDSLTRLGRAFNANIRGAGRIMSGGLDIKALTEPKSIFGAARNIEHGGSLTIIASALIETGSRMDDVIFNEFKGTGNMEIMLSSEMANRRIWPAIDLNLSGTRKEEKLLTPQALAVSQNIRRTLLTKEPIRAMETLLAALQRFKTNDEFAASFSSQALR